MTNLRTRKSHLRFTTCDEKREGGKYRAVIIEAEPEVAILRLAGLRTRLTLSWVAIYDYAAKLKADAKRREIREAKKARR